MASFEKGSGGGGGGGGELSPWLRANNAHKSVGRTNGETRTKKRRGQTVQEPSPDPTHKTGKGLVTLLGCDDSAVI